MHFPLDRTHIGATQMQGGGLSPRTQATVVGVAVADAVAVGEETGVDPPVGVAAGVEVGVDVAVAVRVDVAVAVAVAVGVDVDEAGVAVGVPDAAAVGELAGSIQTARSELTAT